MGNIRRYAITLIAIVAFVVVYAVALGVATGFGIGITGGTVVGAMGFIGGSIVLAPVVYVVTTRIANYAAA